jgi:hypothetical protein
MPHIPFAARTALFAALLGLAPGTTILAQHAPHSGAPPKLDAAAWRSDLGALTAELRRLHPAPFAMISEARFDSAVGALEARLGAMSDREAALGFMAITALIEDGHSGAIGLLGHFGFAGYYPLRTTVEDGELRVVATGAARRAIVGGRIVRIGDLSGREALERVLTICSGDNDFSRMDRAPLFLMSEGVLRGLGIQRADGPLRVEVELATGAKPRRVSATLTAVAVQGHPVFFQDPLGIPGEGRATILDALAGPLPLHLRHPERAWWYEWMPEHRLLYFHFRRVDREHSGQTFADFTSEMFAFADSAGAEHMVIDMRHNGGGDNSILQPLIHGLIRRDRGVNRPGRLFTIIGRETYSAAMNCANWLEEHTATTFAGEPTGARPNHYGDATTVMLPASRMPVRISRYPWMSRWPWDARHWIAPHLVAPPTVAAASAGRDPALDAVFAAIAEGPLEPRLEAALVAGRGEEARAIYARHRERHPDRWDRTSVDDMTEFAERLFGSGHADAALELARILTEAHPTVPRVWVALGTGQWLSGQKELALEQFRKALELDPGNAAAERWLRRAEGR